jgi:hypothetical protein
MRDEAADRALLDALQMENDLLSMEIGALRAELGSGRSDPDDPSARTVSAERLEQLQLAERDLKRLLARLGSGVPGWFLRRTRAYRNLEQRHGAGDGA